MTSKNAETSPEVPIFLRKTYHMIDTCDPEIACWSDDGETFVVKDPIKFEKTIIPQFFKHSKFSSFVRQLNFYSFRKIKYADTIRIDPELEKETANYWRFRHENFRRGRPDLLTEIKRMNGQKATPSMPKQPGEKLEPSDKSTKNEVAILKKRLEEMNKHIDQLTSLVQKVSLKQEEQERIALAHEEIPVGTKRTRIEPTEIIRPDAMLSTMELDEVIPEVPLSVPLTTKRETSVMTNISDSEFVDELFNAFTDDQNEDFDLDETLPGTAISDEQDPDPVLFPCEPETLLPEIDVGETEESNRPDPALMNRLGDALALLPKDLQTLIVDRLISAILSPDVNAQLIAAVMQQVDPKKVAAGGKALPVMDPELLVTSDDEKPSPLVAATLAALLHHYTTQVKGKNPKNVQKSIPVIPVHA